MRLRLDPFSQNGISSVQSNTTIIGTGTTTTGGGGASSLADLTDVDSTVASPSDGDIIVYRDAGSDWVLEAKPAGGSNPALNDVTDVTISAVADNEVLAYDSGTTTWINQTASEAGLAAASHTHTESDITDLGTYQVQLAEGAFVDGDKTKLDGIEAGADVTDTANVTAAGALMDSEVTNLAQVKAFDSADYATAAQGALADSALQNITGENIADLSDVVVTTPADNEVMAYDTTSGNWINQTASEAGIAAASHTHTASQVTDFDTEVSNNTDVAANTAARHDAVTVTDSAEIDFTLTGQDITASLKAGSIDETKLDTSTNASLDLADSSVQPGDNISTLTNDSGFTSNTGDVVGPASSTDNAIPRFDGTGGKTLQASTASVTDTGTLESAGNILAASGTIQAGAGMLTDSVGEWTPAAGVTVDGVLIKDGEVDGRDVSVDGTKLDGIESGATANSGDVTAASGFGTDNSIVRADGTGKGVQTSDVTIDDTGTLAFGIGSDGDITGASTINGVSVPTAQYTSAKDTKLSGIETGADVTDTANVTAAGALMDSEVDADIKTLSLPANTTISTFGASLIDDADAATARTTLGLGNVDNTSDTTKNSATATLTNKTIDGNDNTLQDIGQESLQATVAFKAYRSSARSISGLVDINPDTENYDLGSDFDTGTALFTAPYAGVYSFVANAVIDASTQTRGFIQFICSTAGTFRCADVEGTKVRRVTGTLEVQLAASETVKAQVFTSNTVNIANTDTYFAGHLLGRTD